MVVAYWEIGKRIVEEEQKGNKRAGYGEALLKDLSEKLTTEFGKGFSVAGLKNYRQFYLTFSSHTKGSAVRSESSTFEKDTKSSALQSELQKKKSGVLKELDEPTPKVLVQIYL